MEWYIDGYNVLISHGLGHDESSREWLSREIGAHFAGKRTTVTIVYDSRVNRALQVRPLSERLREVYIGNADQYLVEQIRSSSHPRQITLVTSDVRDIVSAVKSKRPRVIDATKFLRMLKQKPGQKRRPPEKPAFETPENIERYLELFQTEEDKS